MVKEFSSVENSHRNRFSQETNRPIYKKIEKNKNQIALSVSMLINQKPHNQSTKKQGIKSFPRNKHQQNIKYSRKCLFPIKQIGCKSWLKNFLPLKILTETNFPGKQTGPYTRKEKRIQIAHKPKTPQSINEKTKQNQKRKRNTKDNNKNLQQKSFPRNKHQKNIKYSKKILFPSLPIKQTPGR